MDTGVAGHLQETLGSTLSTSANQPTNEKEDTFLDAYEENKKSNIVKAELKSILQTTKSTNDIRSNESFGNQE